MTQLELPQTRSYIRRELDWWPLSGKNQGEALCVIRLWKSLRGACERDAYWVLPDPDEMTYGWRGFLWLNLVDSRQVPYSTILGPRARDHKCSCPGFQTDSTDKCKHISSLLQLALCGELE